MRNLEGRADMKNAAEAYFPLFVDLSDKKIVVIGAGNIASRRVKILADFCADITVAAPEASGEILSMEAAGKIKLLRKPYEKSDIKGAFIVLAAADDAALNRQIYDDCKNEGIIVNAASDKSLCDFYFPGIVKKDSMVVGISASGTAHKKAHLVREACAAAIETVMSKEQDDQCGVN